MLGDPQFGAFSPLNVIIGTLTGGTSSGFIFYWLLMWWLGGFGILMLARHLKAPPWGAGVWSPWVFSSVELIQGMPSILLSSPPFPSRQSLLFGA